MKSFRFSGQIDIREGNPFIYMRSDLVAHIKPDWKRPMPVKIRVNGQPKDWWRINMMPVGNGDFYLYLHGDVRKASKTGVGDTVDVEIVFDDVYKNGPQHPMPDWFKVALDKNRMAHENWLALPPSRQKEILRYFSWLKSDEAKARNLEKAMKMLSGEPGRFMARTWKDGK